jgi:hypothetical protein
MIAEARLLNENVGYTEHEGKKYFVVEEVRYAFPHTKFPREKIKNLPIGSFLRDTILASDVQEMTEFDIKILQTLNYNPQKK